MNPLIELLNFWGERFLSFAWPMLWQSSVLIAVLVVLDFAIRNRVRATVRYALWMLVLIKLVLPTSLSLPTSPGYWVQAPAVLDAALVIEIPRESPRRAPEPASILESNSDQPAAPVQERAEFPLQSVATAATISLERTPLLRWPAFIGLSWLVGAVALLFLVIHRGRLAWRLVADASDAPDEVQSLVGECARQLGASSRIAAKLTDALATPVVCGLFRPVILLPKSLTDRLAPEQLQAVLLHELAHVRRGDLWVSHLQTALQILHFYNPLLWLANARIRRVREEAVDEMVLVALADNAEVYPETLLNVAKLSRQSPRLAFGLIGILESKRSLGARIRLMLLRPWPKSARLGVNGIIALLVLGAMLLPMSCAKDRRATPAVPGPTTPPQVSFEVKFVELPEEAARELREKLSVTNGSSAELRTSATNFWAFALTAPQAKGLLGSLESAPNTSVVSAPQVAAVSSGRQAHIEMTNLLRLITHPVVIDAPAGKMRYAETPGISRQIPIGPMVDVRPVVSSDGYSLQLTIVPTITEFLGYNEPRMITIDSPVKAPDPLAPPTIAAIASEERAARRTESIASSPLTAQLPSPRIVVRQLVTISTGWDGQPILLGGLIADRVQQVKEKVPVLGDLPMLGKLFRSESAADSKKSLLIFITPTIVDSAGNPVHSDADMPFRKNSIPPQKLSESPQAPEPPERKAHIEGAGAELNKIERVSPARQAMLRKLDTIRFDEVNFERASLVDVILELKTRTEQRDPDKRGINFMIAFGDSTNWMDRFGVIVNLHLQNATLAEVLDAVVKAADQPIRYSVEDYAVYFIVRRNENSTQQFNPRAGSTPGSTNASNDGQDSALRIDEQGRYWLRGRELNSDELAHSISYTLRNFSKTIYVSIADNAPASAVSRFAKACNEFGAVAAVVPYTMQGGPSVKPYKAITAPKLTLDMPPGSRVTYDSMNVAVQPSVRSFSGGKPVLRIDEHGRYWLGTNALSLDELQATIAGTKPNSSRIINVTVADNAPAKAVYEFAKICDRLGAGAAITRDSKREGMATNSASLDTRFFKVDPLRFYQGTAGFGSTNLGFFGNGSFGGFGTFPIPDAGQITAKAREFFTALGLDLTPPKAIVFYNNSGVLMVCATLEELSFVDKALQELNMRPPQVKIEAKFVEIKREDAKASGFAWQSDPLILSTTNILGSPSRGNSSVPRLAGILSDPQFQVAIQALEKRAGTDIIAAPAVTTLSGRAARIEVTASTNIVVQGQTQTIQLGPSLEVLAEVLPDNSVIELTVSAVVVQFFGYHDPGPGEDRTMLRFRDGDWVEEPGPTSGPIPRIRVRKLKFTAPLRDGQTLVLGNPVGVNDNPAEPPGYKQLVVFVKPTIIDPAGNPIHTDADLPARTNSIPVQKAISPQR